MDLCRNPGHTMSCAAGWRLGPAPERADRYVSRAIVTILTSSGKVRASSLIMTLAR